MNTIRASVVQACTARNSLDATLGKLEDLTRLAKDRDQSQLVVFPEALYAFTTLSNDRLNHTVCFFSVGGYLKYSTFGVVVGERSPEGREEYLRYHSSAIVIPSAATSRISDLSAATGVAVVVGVIEREQHGVTLYCTVICFDPMGGYWKHRKIAPTAGERVIWGQGDGSTLSVVS